MGKHDKKKGNNDKHNHKHKDDNLADDASLDVAEPEKIVGDGTPKPDYPRYRVEPRELVRLKDIDPDEHEHFKNEEDSLDELRKQLKRISKLTGAPLRRKQAESVDRAASDGYRGQRRYNRWRIRGSEPRGVPCVEFQSPNT